MSEKIPQKITMISIKEAAELVNGLTKYRIRQMCLENQIPYIKAGRNIFSTKKYFLTTFVAKTAEHFW